MRIARLEATIEKMATQQAVLAERDPVPPWAVGAQLGPHNAAPKPNPDGGRATLPNRTFTESVACRSVGRYYLVLHHMRISRHALLTCAPLYYAMMREARVSLRRCSSLAAHHAAHDPNMEATNTGWL